MANPIYEDWPERPPSGVRTRTNIFRTWSKAMLGASPRAGCINEELTRVHLHPGIGRIILYCYG
jgi:hypothetical protein